jgi:dTDP-4-dehydrorhamnose 3,5-epimerase-like enzyme
VLFDDKKNSKIDLIDINPMNYGLIKIPSGTWYSFKSADDKPALIVNTLSGTYDQSESERLPIDTLEIPYDWSKCA